VPKSVMKTMVAFRVGAAAESLGAGVLAHPKQTVASRQSTTKWMRERGQSVIGKLLLFVPPV